MSNGLSWTLLLTGDQPPEWAEREVVRYGFPGGKSVGGENGAFGPNSPGVGILERSPWPRGRGRLAVIRGAKGKSVLRLG